MFVGIMAPLIGVVFGTVLGIASAYFGKLFDLLTQRLVDTVLILPGIVVAMTITVAFGFTVPVVIMALAVSYSASSVRVVRSRALTLSNMQYVEAARAIGSSDTRIIFRHLVPNSLPVTMVLIAVSVGAAITAEAALSFLGIGIQPPIPSWGNMLTTAQLNFDFAPHVAIAPGLAITFVVLAVNLFGDSLRDVLDPRLRNVR
jgi:ABC-type dipeptide/oligopeptide/nickel transport system permease subunit